MAYDEYIMYLNTVQGTAIKTLTEALKEVLTDINIKFDKDGFTVINMDPGQISFVSLKLHAEKFEEYYCPKLQSFGVNMLALHKLLKTIGNNDTLSLYVTKQNPDKLGICIQNKKKRINNNITYNISHHFSLNDCLEKLYKLFELNIAEKELLINSFSKY